MAENVNLNNIKIPKNPSKGSNLSKAVDEKKGNITRFSSFSI